MSSPAFSRSRNPTAARVLPAFLLHGVWDELGKRGVSVRELERLSGVARCRRGDFLSTVTEQDLVRFFDAAVALTQDDTLGLSLGRAFNITGCHLVGHLILASFSLRQAIELVSGTGPHWREAAIEELPGDRMRFGFYEGERSTVGARVKDQLIGAVLYQMAEHFLDRTQGEPAVQFAFPAPADVSAYRRAFPGGVQFDADGTFVNFARRALIKRRSGADSALVQKLFRLAQDYYGAAHANSEWTSRVRRALHAHAAPRLVNPEELAAQLGLSARSLWRRLGREGSSFSTLLDEALYERARALLARPRATSTQVAEALGYAELSSFYRAFRRWSGGQTPSAFFRQPQRESAHAEAARDPKHRAAAGSGGAGPVVPSRPR